MAYTYVNFVDSDPFYKAPPAVHQNTYKRNLGAIVTAVASGFSAAVSITFHSLFENYILLEAGLSE